MKNNSLKGFGQRLHLLIRQSPYDQSEVAKKINVSPSTVTAWIKEDYYPNTKTLIKLADLLNTTMDYLTRGKEMTKIIVLLIQILNELKTRKISH